MLKETITIIVYYILFQIKNETGMYSLTGKITFFDNYIEIKKKLLNRIALQRIEINCIQEFFLLGLNYKELNYTVLQNKVIHNKELPYKELHYKK